MKELVAVIALSASALAQAPTSWHEPLSPQERIHYGWGGPNTPVAALIHAAGFPKVRILAWPGDLVKKNAPPNMQINAWESNMVINVPVEMIRWLDDQQMLTFLIAHEAGHAQQEQLYGQSCYTAPNVRFSTFDVLRSLGDIAGGAATKGGIGAAESVANLKKQACEDDADARAVKLMRQAGLDPSAGIRLFTKIQQLQGTSWQAMAQQFTSDHSVGPLRIAHIAVLARKETMSASVNDQTSSASITVALPGNPFGIVVSRDQQWAFVSFSANHSSDAPGGIATLRTQEGEIKVHSVRPMKRVPSGIVLTHDDKLLIAAAQDCTVFFDTHRLVTGDGNAAFQWICEGPNAGSIDVNVTADDKTLFVSNERAGTITVIDMDVVRSQGYDSDANLQRLDAQSGDSAAILGRIPLGISPVAITLSRDQRWLYVTSEVAAPSWRWPEIIPRENSRPDQKSAKDPEGAVVVVDVLKAKTDPQNAVVARIPAGGSPVRLALSHNGDRLFVTARNSDAVLVLDTTKFFTDPTHARLATIRVGKSPVPIALVDDDRIAVVGNSDRWAAGSEPSTLSVLDTARIGTTLNPVIGSVRAGAFPRNFCLSPDGRTLFLTNYKSGSLQIMEVSSLPHPETH